MFSWVERERRVERVSLVWRKKGVMVGGCVCVLSVTAAVLVVLFINLCRLA